MTQVTLAPFGHSKRGPQATVNRGEYRKEQAEQTMQKRRSPKRPLKAMLGECITVAKEAPCDTAIALVCSRNPVRAGSGDNTYASDRMQRAFCRVKGPLAGLRKCRKQLRRDDLVT